MKRPEFWYQLPYCVQQHLVNNVNLDYDGYESSSVEAAERVLNDPTYYQRNSKLVQSYYKGLSDDSLKQIVQNNLDSLKRQVEELENFLK